MKKKKLLTKIMALTTAVAMALGCAGCGNAESNDSNSVVSNSGNVAGTQNVTVKEDDGTLKVAVQSLPATLDANHGWRCVAYVSYLQI